MSKRLYLDHENAKYMESLLRKVPNIVIDESQRDINMVFFDVLDERKPGLKDYMFENGVKILDFEEYFRFVTHYDVTREEIEKAVNLVIKYFS